MKLKHIGLGVAAVLLAVECAFIPAEANALTSTPRGGPVEAPGGTYVLQGQIVSFCLSHGGQVRNWTEWNTDVKASGPGNCPAGWTQVSFAADPAGWPIPSPSPSASG